MLAKWTLRTFFGLICAIALNLVTVTAQEGGQNPPPSQGPPAGGGTTGPSQGPRQPGQPGQQQQPFPGSPRDRQQQGIDDPNRQPFPEMQRPIFLSGKVVLDDGTPPPDSVVIERVCNGQPRPEAYTDSKGRFSFQLGQNMSMMADASVSSAADGGFGNTNPGFGGGPSRGGMMNTRGISERDLMGCELRAVLPGFRSEIVNLSGRRAFDNPDVGTIVLRRLANVEGTTISATSLNAPKDARKAFDKGRDRLKKKKDAEAQKEFEKAVAVYPKYAAAWFELGRLYQKQDKIEEARNAHSQALAADAKYVSPYLELALLSARENKWQDVADTTSRALKLNPFDFPAAYFYHSVASLNLGKLDDAEQSAREALKLDPNHRMPKLEHVLGVILAQKQDFAGAAESMRSFLKFAPTAPEADTVRKQLGEIEKRLSPAASTTP
ncbi:MAG: tetratricopeptide repeat protein [Bryobacteraceae bacterium]